MDDVVNLRAVRKRTKRIEAEHAAAANRLAHGRAKAERALTRSLKDKAHDDLARHRIEPGTEQ